MSVAKLMRPEWTLVNLQADSPDSVIDALSAPLLAAGAVRPTFAEAVKARERHFPTGLPTGGVQVALPHTDAEHVAESAIAVGTLAAPVPFRVMGDPAQTVAVRLVFLLAIADPGQQAPTLAELANLLMKAELLEALAAAADPEAACRLIAGAAAPQG